MYQNRQNETACYVVYAQHRVDFFPLICYTEIVETKYAPIRNSSVCVYDIETVKPSGRRATLMNFLIINGSPKGEYSITLQTSLYLEAKNPNHNFRVLDVGKKTKSLERDFRRQGKCWSGQKY